MRTIHKAHLNVGKYGDALNGVWTQPGAKFLSVHDQGGSPTIWYTVPDDGAEKTEYHNVHVVGTGQDTARVPINGFLGSCFCGQFVWHVFVGES